jgi:hypothetical protein
MCTCEFVGDLPTHATSFSHLDGLWVIDESDMFRCDCVIMYHDGQADLYIKKPSSSNWTPIHAPFLLTHIVTEFGGAGMVSAANIPRRGASKS